MSEMSQGPGWWLATDGKWYPPEEHPGQVTPAAASAPPATPTLSSAEPEAAAPVAYQGLPSGWYRDPSDPASARYWDGTTLGDEKRPVAHPAVAVSQPTASQPISGQPTTTVTTPGVVTPTPYMGSTPGGSASPPPLAPMAPTLSPSPSDNRPFFKEGWFWLCIVAVILVIGIVVSNGDGTSNGNSNAASNTGTVASTTTTVTAPASTLPAPTTTTIVIPSAPQPTADGAGSALINAWAGHNQPRALSVATTQAVATLFANTYVRDGATDRGCSTGSPPVTCTFGPPGGGSPNDPIYSLTVAQAPGGKWYISSVQVLG